MHYSLEKLKVAAWFESNTQKRRISCSLPLRCIRSTTGDERSTPAHNRNNNEFAGLLSYSLLFNLTKYKIVAGPHQQLKNELYEPTIVGR
jgi:hypothetical protein